jgi:hypothetical protein
MNKDAHPRPAGPQADDRGAAGEGMSSSKDSPEREKSKTEDKANFNGVDAGRLLIVLFTQIKPSSRAGLFSLIGLQSCYPPVHVI